MKRWMSLVLVALTVVGCKRGAEDAQLSAVKQYAAAEVQIEHLRKKSPPDWAGVRAQLEICMPTVKRIDAAHQLGYEAEMLAALEQCEKGEKAAVNQQTFAKGLQHVTVLCMQDELKAMSATGGDAAQRVAAYFEGIRPTIVRRDENFFPQDQTLTRAVESALEKLVEAGDGAALMMIRRDLEAAVDQAYALSVLFEFLDVEAKRDVDMDTCEKKMAEAKYFYRTIAEKVKQRSPKADAIIVKMLEAGVKHVDAQVAETALLEAFSKDFKLR